MRCKFKNIEPFVTVLFCLVVVVLTSNLVSNETVIEKTYTISTPYEYPVLPGTQEWIGLGNHLARVKACQIPEDVLSEMDTQALIQTILNYPFIHNMYLYNDLQTGYKILRDNFNGLQELESREDSLESLNNFLQNSPPYSKKIDAENLYMFLSDSAVLP